MNDYGQHEQADTLSERDLPQVDVLDYVHPYRPEWNKYGPRLPKWFQRRVQALDRNIVFQFAPPSDWVEIVLGQKGGANPSHYPEGVWIVGRRFRNTGMVLKTSVLNVFYRGGVLHWIEPGTNAVREVTPATVDMLRFARDEQQRGGDRRTLEEAADLAYQEMVNAADAASRDVMRKRAAKTLAALNARVPYRVSMANLN